MSGKRRVWLPGLTFRTRRSWDRADGTAAPWWRSTPGARPPVAVPTVLDCRAHWEGRSSSHRAWAGMARHPVGGGRSGAHRGHGASPAVRSAENLTRRLAGVSQGLTGRTGDHPDLNYPYPAGPANCLARIPTGSRRGTAVSGWRGFPTTGVSPRSTGSRGDPAMSGW